MDVLVVGGGAREHALAWKINQSPECERVFMAPGNGGTQDEAENIPLAANDIYGLTKFANQNNIGLTIVGPEEPLELGIVDIFNEEKLPIFGPTKAAAEIETSKAFAKRLMEKNNIPTAEFRAFDVVKEAIDYAQQQENALWIKTSEPADGKGALYSNNPEMSEEIINDIMIHGKFGEAGKTIVIENHLIGPEVSLHALCDGQDFLMMPTSQDYKRFYEGGSNTGGLGAIAPYPRIRKNAGQRLGENIVSPTLEALKEEGVTYTGALYPGLKLTVQGARVVEFNARFGDPETQVLMRLLKSDFLKLVMSCVEGNLADQETSWHSGFAACVVLASGGYPGNYETGHPISGLKEAKAYENVEIFHAGTVDDNGQLKTNGGRVLSVTATGRTLRAAISKAYEAARKIQFKDKKYHHKIGEKALAYPDRYPVQ